MKNQRGIVWAPLLIIIGVVVVAGIAGYVLIQTNGTSESENSNENVAVVNQKNNNSNTNPTPNANRTVDSNSSTNSNQTANVNTSTNTNTQNTDTTPSTNQESFVLSEIGMTISFPENYTLAKNSEKNRRGSYAAYQFQISGNPSPKLYEIQLFSSASIAECEARDVCFFGDYPTTARYNGQKAALENGSSYEGFELKSFNGRSYLVGTHRVVGDIGYLREYTFFADTTKVDIWIFINEQSEIDAADALFEEVVFSESA